MSISQAHSDAARRNGAQSYGPVTEEGRRRSSRNARKHSFFSAYATLPDEDRAAFDAMLAAYLEEHQPQTITESHFVHDLADADWRLQRVRNHLVELQSKTMRKFQVPKSGGEAFDYLAKEGPTLSLLLRYETKFQRQYEKALQQLLALQSSRASRAPAVSQSRAETAATSPTGKPPDPPPLPEEPHAPAKPQISTLQNEPKPQEPSNEEPTKPVVFHARLVTLDL